MIKTKLIFLTLFFFSLNIYTIKSSPNPAIPENYFVPLNSRELVQFELNRTKNELYFYFQNNFEDSDIIINLKVAKGFTTYCYIYDSYDKIEVDSKGDYINSLKNFCLTENSMLLKNSELQIKKTKYYIIIKDLINSYNKDYISIFNEQDTISLTSEKYITFEKFYSKNKYYLSFSHTKDEMVTLQLNTDNAEFSQYISIFSEKENEFIYKGIKNKGQIKINEKKENEGTYIVEIESQEEPYKNVKASIILYKEEKYVKELKYNSPSTYSFSGDKIFNFYVDIDDYDYNEENIVTFKFGNQIYNRNLLSHCYAKVMNFEKNEDFKFLANMPANEDENEAVFSRLSGTTDIYQLYFRKTKEKEQNKKSFLLINLSIKLDEHDTKEYLEPDEFTIYLSNKPEKIDLAQYKNINKILNRNIKLRNYVPEIYRIILPKIDENSIKLSYIFYSSENMQVFYNNSMLYNSHLYEKSKKIHVLSNIEKGYDYSNVIYVKFYGFTNKEINFKIESTEALIYYINNENRQIKSFTNKITDCSKPFYYLGNYGDSIKKGYFYQETLYGQIITYYKNIVNSDDESILINEDEKYLVKDRLFSLETSIDIVELKCEYPGLYQIHLIDDVEERDIDLYSKIYNYLPAQKNFTISPVLNPLQKKILFEISTPMGKEIQISDGQKIIKLDSNNKYCQIKYKNYTEVPPSFTVLSNENTIITISLTNNEPFSIVETEKAYVNENLIVIKLPQNKNYESANLVITRISNRYSFSIFKGNVNYASKLVDSEIDYIITDMSHNINMTISNPYLRDENNNIDLNDENDAYYLLFSIDDPEMVQKKVMLTYNEMKEYEKIDIGNSKTITNQNQKYSLPSLGKEYSNINIVYQGCGNSLKDINIYNYNDKLQTIINNKNESYSHNIIKIYYLLNLQVGISLKNAEKEIDSFLNGAVIGLTDQQVTDEDINKYSNMKLNISQNGSKVEWESIDEVNQYDIFVLDENNSYVPYLKNPCLLESIKNNNLNYTNNNKSYIKYYSSSNNFINLEEKGKYFIAVSASIKGKIPLIYIYDKIIYDSSLIPPEPEPEPDDDDKKDEDKDNGGNDNIIFLAISLPLSTIIVLILLIALVKSKKEPLIELQPKESLIKDTSQSFE